MNTRPLFRVEDKSIGPVAWIAGLLLLLALGAMLAGCMSRPALKRQTFALQPPPLAKTIAPSSQSVLAVSKVEVNPLFEGRSFVYRTGADHYQVDPYAGFLISSGRMLPIPIRNYLRNSGVFKDVVEPGSQLRPNTFLEVYVTELYGDLRQSGQPAAVLSIRMLFFDSESDKAQKPVLNKLYVRRVPMQEKSPAALVAGWNQALAQTMAEVASDLASARERHVSPLALVALVFSVGS